MAEKKLEGMRIAVLAADGFEEVELTSPKKALEEEGATVDVISLRAGKIRGMNVMLPGKSVEVDRTLDEVDADTYDALFLPGGFISPDTLRQSERALEFVRAFYRAGKPIAAICHAPWELISAGLVSGRRLTSWPGIKDDVTNAGGLWQDAPVVRDGVWITSRSPLDLPQFNEALIGLFAEHVPAEPRAALRTPPKKRHVGRWVAVGAALAAAALTLRRT